jgi:hypothetical protein
MPGYDRQFREREYRARTEHAGYKMRRAAGQGSSWEPGAGKGCGGCLMILLAFVAVWCLSGMIVFWYPYLHH